MSRQSNERRPACGKTSINDVTFWLGGCDQPNTTTGSASGSLSPVTIFRNVTKVPALIIADPPIDPYERPASILVQPVCSTYYEDDPTFFVCGDGINGNRYCNIPQPIDVNVNCTTSLQVTSSIYSNCFVSSSVTESLPHCRKQIGFKNVFAKKKWHGRVGYRSRDWLAPDTMGFCCRCQVHTQDTSADTIHYLGVNGTSHYEAETNDVAGGITYFTSSDASATTIMNRYSGELTTATCASSSNATGDAGTTAIAEAITLLQIGNENINLVATTYCEWYVTYTNLFGTATSEVDDSAGSGSAWTVTWNLGDIEDPRVIISIDLNGSCTLDTYIQAIPVGGGPVGRFHNGHVSLAFTDNTVAYVNETFAETYQLNAHSTRTFSGQLTHSYTSAQVETDKLALLDFWPMGDDNILPWRTDTDVTMGPLISYNENLTNNVTIPQCSYVNSGLYDGNIMGKPLPAGYDRWWNPAHPNYKICTFNNGTEDCRIKYVESYGAWSTECHVKAATQWVNQNDKTMLPQPPFNGANFSWTTPSECNPEFEARITDNISWAGKYAEIIIDKPSFNFARPCGVDRLAISASSNRCIKSASIGDRTITLEDYTGATSPFVTNDYAWICGMGTDWDGIWKVASSTAYDIILTSNQIASASHFPEQPFENCGTGMIGKMKWYGMGVCGRVDIVDATPTIPVTCSLLEPSYFIAGDNVHISGSRGITSINGFWTIQQVLDSSHVILSGSNGTSQSAYIPNSGQIYGTWSPDYLWNDSGVKGDFVIRKWNSKEFRQLGEYSRLAAQSASIGTQTSCNNDLDALDTSSCAIPFCPPYPTIDLAVCSQSCLAFNACKASVVYFSPVTESLLQTKYNYFYGGWGDILCDGLYESMWNGQLVQYIADPLWQRPPCPCFLVDVGPVEGPVDLRNICSGQWIEDVGYCFEDDPGDPGLGILPTSYYSRRPYVEARCTSPDGAPTFIEDMLGCKVVGQCIRPENFGYLHYEGYVATGIYEPYHNIYLTEMTCICAVGRWSDIYQRQRISCQPL